MIRRNTWILLVVFAVLLVAAVYLQRSGGLGSDDVEITPPVEEQQLLDVDAQGIRSFRILDAQGKVLAVERSSQGVWILTEPQATETDMAKVDSVITGLTTLGVMNTLETNIALDVVGLTEPAYTLEIGLVDGGQHVIQIGDPTPTGTGYYARLDGSAPVVVSKFAIDSAVELLTTPPVIATDAPTTEAGIPEDTGTPAPATPSP